MLYTFRCHHTWQAGTSQKANWDVSLKIGELHQNRPVKNRKHDHPIYILGYLLFPWFLGLNSLFESFGGVPYWSDLLDYPLVYIQKTMEPHHFSWEKQLFRLGHGFKFANCSLSTGQEGAIKGAERLVSSYSLNIPYESMGSRRWSYDPRVSQASNSCWSGIRVG